MSQESDSTRSLCRQLSTAAAEAYYRGDLSRALSLYERVKGLAEESQYKEILGPVLYWIGKCNFVENRFEKARDAYILAKQILEDLKENTTGQQTEQMAYILIDLGVLYLNTGEYAEAKKSALECLALSQSLWQQPGVLTNTIRYVTASSLGTLGNVATWEGDHEGSLAYLQESLRLSNEMNTLEPRYQKEVAERLTDMGLAHKAAGDHLQALHCLNQALTLTERMKQKDALQRVLNCLGILYLDQGDYATATKYLQASLATAEELGSKFHSVLLTTNLAFAKLREGDHRAALVDFERALKTAQGTAAPHSTIPILEGLGAVYLANGSYDLALKSFDKAFDTAYRLGDKSRQAEILWWKGEVLYRQGDHENALRFSDDAYALTSQLGMPNLTRLALTLKGKVHLARKQYDLASEALSIAIETIEHMRVKAAGQEQQRALFFEGKLEPYHLMVELQIARQNNHEALLYAERAKGRILLDVIRAGKANVNSVITAEERERDHKLNAEIVSLNTQFYTEKLQSQPDNARMAALRTTLDKTRLEYQTFRDGIYVAHPELRKRSVEAHFTIDELSRLLPDPQTALLEFVVMDEKTYLFAVSKTNKDRVEIESFPIAVKKGELKGLVETFRDRLGSPHFALQHAGRRLFDLLLGPAAAVLADKRILVIVPDSVLWDLPFQALRQPANRYLIEDHALSYSPSLNVLSELSKRKIDRPVAMSRRPGNPAPEINHKYRSHLLAFGNPQLSRQTIERATSIHRDEKLLPLPEAQREVKSLQELYGTHSSKVYIGAAAHEQNAKEEMGKYRVLHFATHGMLDGANPMYSHIVLSGGDGSNEDGLLEAWEIMKLDLGAELAVLSACETARGRIGAGEGVIGMSWAFFVAGCPTTVASQWKVDSMSTSQLMIEFHRNVSSMSVPSKAEALRRAALKLLHGQRYKHPFYWAGFILIGDGS